MSMSPRLSQRYLGRKNLITSKCTSVWLSCTTHTSLCLRVGRENEAKWSRKAEISSGTISGGRRSIQSLYQIFWLTPKLQIGNISIAPGSQHKKVISLATVPLCGSLRKEGREKNKGEGILPEIFFLLCFFPTPYPHLLRMLRVPIPSRYLKIFATLVPAQRCVCEAKQFLLAVTSRTPWHVLLGITQMSFHQQCLQAACKQTNSWHWKRSDIDTESVFRQRGENIPSGGV